VVDAAPFTNSEHYRDPFVLIIEFSTDTYILYVKGKDKTFMFFGNDELFI